MATPTPMVIDRGGKSPRAWDLYSRMMEDRVIFINGVITGDMASNVVTQLLWLHHANDTKRISMYINSPGGHVTDGMAIYDTMHYIKPPIRTICAGRAASMAAILLTAGAKGERLALPHSKMMIHQPSGGFCGQATDVVIQADEITKTKKLLNKVLSHHTGKPLKEVTADTERDYYMDTGEAIEYGLIDDVIESYDV